MHNLRNRLPVIEAMEQRLMFDASQLSETIIGSTLPASNSDLNVTHGKVSVMVGNNSGVAQKDKVHLVAVGTTDPTLDLFSQADKQFGFINTTISLADGQSKTYNINVNLKKSSLADGAYTVYVTAIQADGSNTSSQSAAGPVLTIHAPDVQLSETETFVKLPSTVSSGGRFNVTDKISITNSGTDPSSEPLTIEAFATFDGILGDGTSIASEMKKVTIKPNKPTVVSFRLLTFPSIAAGTYSLITQVTTTRGAMTSTDPSTAPTINVEGVAGG